MTTSVAHAPPDVLARIADIRSKTMGLEKAGASSADRPFGVHLEEALGGAGSATSTRPVASTPYQTLFGADQPSSSPDLDALFERAGADHGVDPALLKAVARVESGFDRSAVSPAGAQGLMQFMPATAAEMGVDPLDPASAIDGAARYLARDLARFGQPELAIAAYNAGPGAVARHGGVPPYPETVNYVAKVMEAWRGQP